VGPHEVSANTDKLLGRAKAEARLLSANGWRPIHLIVSTFSDPIRQQTRSIVKQLQRQGLQVRVPEGELPGLQGTQRGGVGHSSGRANGVAAQNGTVSMSGKAEIPLVVGLPSSLDGYAGNAGPTALAESRAPVASGGPSLLSTARY
jgi:hypothetical protein